MMSNKRNFRIIVSWVVVLMLQLVSLQQAWGQRKMEDLDRGLVAVNTASGVFLSWRIQGCEWHNTTYNLYRDGTKLNDAPLSVSNYQDAAGSTTSSYTVTAVVNAIESAPSAPATAWNQQYLEIPLKYRQDGYEINDATAADLDGDGQYEIIVKRIYKDWANASAPFSFFEAYKLDGTFLWEINVGPNILPDVEINLAAFDLDEDGKAEVFMRTSEGTIFGDGMQIGDTDGDGKTNYRSSVGTAANMQYMNEGPEFLSLIDGETGAELDRVDFIARGSSSDWGDNYGHRASKYFFGAPYLDGKKPSLFIGRGIYTKTIMRTYDVVNKKLVFKWEFNSGNSGPYYGQGNHNYTIADVDGDGCDEIAWGSMTVNNDGTGLYSTDLGHGDAMHVGDLDPYRKGIEIFKCLEESPAWGTVLYDGASGEILIHNVRTSDTGRACAANISDDIKGKAVWGGAKMYSASTLQQVGTGSLASSVPASHCLANVWLQSASTCQLFSGRS
ncbi:MAG: rhamnogalacturonan lyase [Bacteroidales bacterium]|nr:rhamnogalacturonan lyase [Bacteroidales bacterium]